MPLVFPNNGEGDGLKFFLNFSAPENLVLRLYSNNITPSETDTAATYTELAVSGYAAINLAGASWSIVEGAPSSASFAEQTFTFTAGGSLYGCFFTRASSGRLAAAELDAVGIYNFGSGSTYKVTPQITLD